ncbi:hypothetical protein GGP41_010466 [Bipolaris sorokiniana]|nr:hypothetical protein GGP41_010466 [Bipolaris sorokiniana]
MAESFHSVVVQAHLAGMGGGVKGASKNEAMGSTRFPEVFARAVPERVTAILQDHEVSLDTPQKRYLMIIVESFLNLRQLFQTHRSTYEDLTALQIGRLQQTASSALAVHYISCSAALRT